MLGIFVILHFQRTVLLGLTGKKSCFLVHSLQGDNKNFISDMYLLSVYL